MSMAIEPIASPALAQSTDVRHRYSAPFGAAVTFSEVVEERLRVDPAAIAARMQAPDPQQRAEKPRPSARAQRLAEEEAAYEARRDARPGAHLDIQV